MITLREVLVAALRGDPDLKGRVAESLREKIEADEGAMLTVVQAAEALEPIINDAVSKRPSKVGIFGLKSARLLAALLNEDQETQSRLVEMAKGSTIGIVFVDISGFTAFTAERGDEAASTLVATLRRIVDAQIQAYRGECVKHLGDGFLLAFPSASQAVRGAVALREAVLAQRESDSAFTVSVRISVHAGEPLVEGDDLLGHDVNLTARLLDECPPDGVLVSQAAKELAERRLKRVAFGRPRSVKVRGLAGRTDVFPVLLDQT